MGFGITELIIILVIVLVLFGAKRLRNVGSETIEGEVTSKEENKS